METFKIKMHFVVLATEVKRDKQYILSSSENDIEIPYTYLDSSLLQNLDEAVIRNVQKIVFANELELMPQLISLHNKFITESPGEINCVYGFIIDKTDNINDSFWIEYDYLTPNKYSNLIFETTQKLK
jgi:hypothetical protein